MLVQVLDMAVCLSVCLSVSCGVLSKRMNEWSWFLVWNLPSIYPTLFAKEIRVSPKVWALPCGTLSQTPDLENFATAH